MINNFRILVFWIARILAAVNIGIVLYFGIGEGFPNYLALTDREQSMFIAWFIMILSSIFAYKWELVFSILIIISYLAMSYINYSFSGTFWIGYFFFIYPVSGLFFLMSWFLGKKTILDQRPIV